MGGVLYEFAVKESLVDVCVFADSDVRGGADVLTEAAADSGGFV